MKTCTRCEQAKPLEQFSRSNQGRDGFHTWCKACKAERTRRWWSANKARENEKDRAQYAADGTRRRAYASQWHVENRERSLEAKRSWKLRRYGLSACDYDALLAEQGHRCALCGEPPSRRRKHDLVVDHCHQMLIVRGLLCHRCNVGLGHFDDSPELLRAAANYIERARRKTA